MKNKSFIRLMLDDLLTVFTFIGCLLIMLAIGFYGVFSLFCLIVTFIYVFGGYSSDISYTIIYVANSNTVLVLIGIIILWILNIKERVSKNHEH